VLILLPDKVKPTVAQAVLGLICAKGYEQIPVKVGTLLPESEAGLLLTGLTASHAEYDHTRHKHNWGYNQNLS